MSSAKAGSLSQERIDDFNSTLSLDSFLFPNVSAFSWDILGCGAFSTAPRLLIYEVEGEKGWQRRK